MKKDIIPRYGIIKITKVNQQEAFIIHRSMKKKLSDVFEEFIFQNLEESFYLHSWNDNEFSVTTSLAPFHDPLLTFEYEIIKEEDMRV